MSTCDSSSIHTIYDRVDGSHRHDQIAAGGAAEPGLGETAKAAAARFFGSVKVDPERYSRDIGNITREIIDRLAGAGARLEIIIDIQAVKTEGFDNTEIMT